jgi:hypothetical protein
VTTGPTRCAVGLGELVDYLLGELGSERAEALEDHLFECGTCADRVDSLERLRAAVANAARRAEVVANVNGAFLERAARDGLTLREYRIPAGEAVPCSAGPEDLVVVRLAAEYGDLRDLALDAELHDLDREEVTPLPAREVVVDRDLDEVVLVFPGALVRSYPRSRWTLRLRGEGAGGPSEIGPFVMDHTP